MDGLARPAFQASSFPFPRAGAATHPRQHRPARASRSFADARRRLRRSAAEERERSRRRTLYQGAITRDASNGQLHQGAITPDRSNSQVRPIDRRLSIRVAVPTRIITRPGNHRECRICRRELRPSDDELFGIHARCFTAASPSERDGAAPARRLTRRLPSLTEKRAGLRIHPSSSTKSAFRFAVGRCARSDNDGGLHDSSARRGREDETTRRTGGRAPPARRLTPIRK
jgi:hypothetical protein